MSVYPLNLPAWLLILWLINGGDPNYLLSGMILQVQVREFLFQPNGRRRCFGEGREGTVDGCPGSRKEARIKGEVGSVGYNSYKLGGSFKKCYFYP